MRNRWVVLAGVAAVCLCALLFRLEAPPFVQADEGLYGRHIAQGRASGVWLYPAEADGSYMSEGAFAKPPLSIWGGMVSKAVFGETLFALRLPFALGAWWVAVALAAYCLFEIRRRGIPKAIVCAALVIGAEGTLQYGRQASLEPMLVGFCTSTVLLYAAALNRRRSPRGRWTLVVLSGLFYLAAIMCKQLVGLLLPLPVIFALELSTKRPQRWTRALGWTALGVVPFGVWIAVTYAVAGDGVIRDLFSFTVDAAQGFDSLTHENYLNRTVYFFGENVAPLSWWVATMAAFLLFGVWLERRGFAEAMRRSALFGYGAAAAGLFLIGATGLPWYPHHLVPAVALAAGGLLVDGVWLVWTRSPWRAGREILIVGAAFVVLLQVGVTAGEPLVPQLTLAAALCLLGLDTFITGRRLSLVVAVVLVAGVWLGSRVTHPTYHDRPLGLPALMAVAHDAPCVRYEKRLKLRYSVERTQLGLFAEPFGPGDEVDPKCTSIGKGALPAGAEAGGARIEHAAGVYAVVPHRPVTAPAGTLRYPAAHLAAGREAVRAGGESVAVHKRVRLHRHGEHTQVVSGRLLLAPEGAYSLVVRFVCDEAWARRQPHRLKISGAKSGGGRKNLKCGPDQLGAELSHEVAVTLDGGPVSVSITTARGGIVVRDLALRPR